MTTRTETDTITLYHGTRNDQLVLHPGICLTDDPDAAALYGPNVFAVEMDYRRYFRAPHLGDGCLDHEVFVGDADLDSIDHDVVKYDDWAPENVMQHLTVRIITDEGLTQIRPAN